MYGFFTPMLKFHKMMFDVGASVTSALVEAQLHFFKQQVALFDLMHASRRVEDGISPPVIAKPRKKKARKSASPCHGPDLKDHYGKRAHDVDVEHI